MLACRVIAPHSERARTRPEVRARLPPMTTLSHSTVDSLLGPLNAPGLTALRTPTVDAERRTLLALLGAATSSALFGCGGSRAEAVPTALASAGVETPAVV